MVDIKDFAKKVRTLTKTDYVEMVKMPFKCMLPAAEIMRVDALVDKLRLHRKSYRR